MLSSRNLLRQALFVPLSEYGDRRTTLSDDGLWTGFTCRDRESVLDKVEGGEEGEEESSGEGEEAVDLEVGLSE